MGDHSQVKLVLFEFVPGSYGFRFERHGMPFLTSSRQYFHVQEVLDDLKALHASVGQDDFIVYDETDEGVFSHGRNDQLLRF